MLCSNCSTSQSPRLRQLKQPLLLRPALRLVCCVRCKSVAAIWAECVTSSRQDVQQVWSSRFTAGRRHAATQAVLQQAAIAAVSCRSVARPIATCHAASGSTLDTPAINPSSSTAENESVLQDLLAWLVANGVTGVGKADSKIALYQDTGGDRGIIAVEDIPAGVELVRVPLRLAITDVMDDQRRSQLVGQGALWQDRLVAKLLLEVQLGKRSSWYPYIRALPRSVPSALESFSASDASDVQFPAPVAAILGHADKMSASWQACRPDAISGADLKTYRWAHSCVMSRTFGNAAPGGGVGVHMMVPLIDMLNHAGDETESGLLSDEPVATDNVRWDIVSLANSPNNCWEMVLSSKQHIHADTPLLLSYFEGSNDEFLLHYGFVPDSNPHDSVQLFGNVSEALEHLWWQEKAMGTSSHELSHLYQRALDAGLAALQQEVEAAAAGAPGPGDTDHWGRLLDQLEPIKIASGSRVNNSLIAALEVLHSNDMAAVEAAVAALAWQQLAALPTTLLYDLALLISDQIMSEQTLLDQDDGSSSQYISILQHYTQALLPDYYPHLAEQLRGLAARSFGSSSSIASLKVAQFPAAAADKVQRKKAVPSPPQLVALPPTAAAAAAAASDTQHQQPQVSRSVPLDLASIPLATLVGLILQLPSSQGQQQQQVDVCSTQQFPSLTPTKKTAVKYRLSKKMLLADVILAARTPLAVLEQQQQLRDKAVELKAGWLQERLRQDDGACLPWLL